MSAAEFQTDQEMPREGGASEQESNKAANEIAGTLDNNNGSSSPNHSTQSNSDFTSEIFKIEIQNLPRFYGIGQMKKLLNQKLKLNSCKLKPVGKTFMFACFRNEEDRQKALSVLDGFTFKNSKLKVTCAKAAEDPYKRKKEEGPTVVDTRTPEQKIQEKVCPYAKLKYDEQLDKKLAEIVTIMKQLGSQVSRANPRLDPIIKRKISDHGTLAPIIEFLKSPVVRGYRNKVEFSVGYMNPTSKLNTENGEEGQSVEMSNGALELDFESVPTIAVGFRLASYKQGSVEVISLTSLDNVEDVLPHISSEMIQIGVLFEKFVKASGILPYNSLTNKGNWRQIMIRSSNGRDRKQIMVVACIDPKDLTSTQIDQVRSDLVAFFQGGAGGTCNVTSLYIHLSPAKRAQGCPEPSPELLMGDAVITETLHNRNFDISPQAFFQVNAEGAEVLYQCVGDLADLNDKTTLVDVCCGTGTIGLCLAHRVKKVIGVELVPEAVRDARKNAEANGLTNCSFFAGRAENILQDVLKDIDSKDIVAVVDPPRAGLHAKALSAIRNNAYIKKLVYVSCDAKAAMKNFVDLCRPESKTCHGDPFLPRKIVPVDLFPHSLGFELVILFERVSEQEVDKYASLAAAPQTIKEEDIHDPGTTVLDNADVKLEAQTVKKEQIT
eukprot:TRINITY_DN5634_c0_g2_i2.p1 TRINITY_DN5634_c0_g2~~TRINITY_DN5634_c0_g2_i2.p1  ORF type:complete len:664 (-),score=136.75 TRINITY_DN5634_c0_g2_i2:71-2062(-)